MIDALMQFLQQSPVPEWCVLIQLLKGNDNIYFLFSHLKEPLVISCQLSQWEETGASGRNPQLQQSVDLLFSHDNRQSVAEKQANP